MQAMEITRLRRMEGKVAWAVEDSCPARPTALQLGE